ncbi:toxic anion resistance protein, partial [Micropruina sp.]|uniref:toxic anion resistance protein n=1 Tax=Micropruina sp. TaxID=2737536 RepID=UPI00260ED12B
MSSTTTPGGAAAMPLQPPATLTLTAPDAPAVITETQAPAMAPQVEATQVPVLDAKVDEFLRALDSAEEKSPTFSAQADAVRSMGDADIRKAAETSNRLLNAPVRALKEGGLSDGSKVGQTLVQLRRTVEDLDPGKARGSKKFLGMIPFGD